MTSRALKGLGVGLAAVGEMGFAHMLASMRDEALARLRGQERAADQAFEAGERDKDRAANASERERDRRAAQALADSRDRLETREIDIPINGTDKDGKIVPIFVQDAQGNQVRATRRAVVARQDDGTWKEITVQTGGAPAASGAAPGSPAAAAPAGGAGPGQAGARPVMDEPAFLPDSASAKNALGFGRGFRKGVGMATEFMPITHIGRGLGTAAGYIQEDIAKPLFRGLLQPE